MIDPSAQLHPTVDVEADAEIGPETIIWNRTMVRTGARIGEACLIGRDVFIDRGVVVGDRVKIENRAMLYHGVTIEDGAYVGPGVILTDEHRPHAIRSTRDLASPTDVPTDQVVLRRGCMLGAGAIVVAGCEIGSFALVGAGAVVTHNVPPHSLYLGNPARRAGWVCACGQRLMTADGDPAPADPDRYALDRTLHCPTCERRWDYVPDADTLEEHPAGSGRVPYA